MKLKCNEKKTTYGWPRQRCSSVLKQEKQNISHEYGKKIAGHTFRRLIKNNSSVFYDFLKKELIIDKC